MTALISSVLFALIIIGCCGVGLFGVAVAAWEAVEWLKRRNLP